MNKRDTYFEILKFGTYLFFGVCDLEFKTIAC